MWNNTEISIYLIMFGVWCISVPKLMDWYDKRVKEKYLTDLHETIKKIEELLEE